MPISNLGRFDLFALPTMSESPEKPGRKVLPGNNLMTHKALSARLDFLQEQQPGAAEHFEGKLHMDQVLNNIESFVGSTEIPLGLVGPLAWEQDGEIEHVFGVVGTTEGALVASMNRGARAIANGNPVTTEFVRQRMLRTPLFAFENATQATAFVDWATSHAKQIKDKAEEASNHATLLELEPVQLEESVHLRFIYTTGDAAGQNMTTACTWHASQWIMQELDQRADMNLVQFGIESNGGSDKKVTRYAIEHGRGCKVTASVTLDDATVRKHLRADPKEMYRAYQRSVKIAEHDGMVGFNINTANAVAAFFASTGQDLACIPESSTAFLELEREGEATRFSLTLTNLVIGSVGGGTGLPGQKTALELMGCHGVGNVQRLASIIAGFALALELSTFAAVVGGQFARAHQVLGRNKPKNWLVRSEVDERFLKSCLSPAYQDAFESISVGGGAHLDNGILTDLSSKVVKKLIGFVPLVARHTDGSEQSLLIKSKATDEEIMKGIHYMASHVDTKLADTLLDALPHMEYRHCNYKEVEVYRFLAEHRFPHLPEFFGSLLEPEREIFLMMEELLQPEELELFNAENSPEAWTPEHLDQVTQALVEFQKLSLEADVAQAMPHVQVASMNGLDEVYELLLHQCQAEQPGWDRAEEFQELHHYIRNRVEAYAMPSVLAHNDFNPRNVAVRKSGRLAIYDWELAVMDSPQRDMVEFLAFVITPLWEDVQILDALEKYRKAFNVAANMNIAQADWQAASIDVAYRFLITRVTFYLLGEPLLDYGFSKRIFDAAFRIIRALK